MLNIHAEFWGNQSCWGGHVVIRIGVWVGCGAEARMLPHCQSTALLCQKPCSKSLLGVYLHMLPHLWCINNLEQGFQHSRWRSNRLMAQQCVHFCLTTNSYPTSDDHMPSLVALIALNLVTNIKHRSHNMLSAN